MLNLAKKSAVAAIAAYATILLADVLISKMGE